MLSLLDPISDGFALPSDPPGREVDGAGEISRPPQFEKCGAADTQVGGNIFDGKQIGIHVAVGL